VSARPARPRTVALLVRNHAPMSAVGADVDGMRRVLEARGVRVHVYSGAGAGRPLSALVRLARREPVLTIYHHTIAWPAGTLSFLALPGPRVLRYHNITPPSTFLPYSPAWAAGAAVGRLETRAILARGGLSLLLPCSAFSRDELLAQGAAADRTAVLSPYELPPTAAAPDPATLARLDDGRSHLLFVGRVAPSKGQHHLIDAVASWRRRWPEEPVRLLLVGGTDPRLAGYLRALRARVSRLGIQDSVELLGAVSAEELEACYARATVFVLASHHEGFCVPIVEAYRRGVPVVAVARTAVPETAGGAAVLLPDFDPEAIAQAAHDLARDPAARAAQAQAGRILVQERYDRAAWEARLTELIGPLLA